MNSKQSKKKNLILLNNLLNLNNLENVKIRFNIPTKDGGFNPIEFFKNKEKYNELMNGQFHNYKSKSFREGQIAIGFARIENDKWLLFDISKITKDLDIKNGVGYKYETLNEYKIYFGRIVVRYHNRATQLIRNANSLISSLEVLEILPEKFNNDDFPGYEHVNISFGKLKRILERKDWKVALENQKGVYLITDTNTGKLYVGSAYGENMILGRWIIYAKSGYDKNELENGNYPNKRLRELVKKKGIKYIEKYFRYSILDIYKSTTYKEIIIHRENEWKKRLMSREFGYNAN